VPHVRLGVRGPKMICFDCFQLDGSAAPNGFSLKDSLKRSWGFPRISCRAYGVGEVHAAFLTESRTRGPVWRGVQEIRVAPSYSAHVR
jgi:hypothetical protein